MLQQRTTGNDPQQAPAWYIFECTMSVFYLAFSALFLFTNVFIDIVYGQARFWVGVLLGVYGIFRIYRALKKLFKKKEE